VQLTVVIPTFNEAENLPRLLSALLGLPIEGLKILVVDDNSPDGTGQIADEIAAQQAGRLSVLHRPGKLGLGTAYIQGFQLALQDGAQAVAQMDADFSHPPEILVDLYQALQNCDVAMGSRYIPGGSVDRDWPAWRKGLSSFGNIYARLILRIPVRDTTGGFRMWRKRTLERMPLERVRSNGYAFQVEMAYIACRLGFHFQEIPFYFADRKWGQSKMSFRIQREAAVRVWQLLYEYRALRPIHRPPDA
jgi:dolichol-phosphate mannosyltransferase